jgi:hypothetical protein
MDNFDFNEYEDAGYIFYKFDTKEMDRYKLDISGFRCIETNRSSFLVTLYTKHLDEYTLHQFEKIDKLEYFLQDLLITD